MMMSSCGGVAHAIDPMWWWGGRRARSAATRRVDRTRHATSRAPCGHSRRRRAVAACQGDCVLCDGQRWEIL